MENYFDEDYPQYEPTQADEILNEFQEKMKEALHQTIRQEIESIKKENEKLKTDNSKLRDLVGETSKRERDLESKKRTLVSDIRRERLTELMKDFQVVFFKVNNKPKEKTKCNKCNDNRQIPYKTPLGKELAERCECDYKNNYYEIEEYLCTEFKIDRENKKLFAWYAINRGSDHDYASSITIDEIWQEPTKFEEIKNYYSIYFRNKEDCQKYCDWLNENEENTK